MDIVKPSEPRVALAASPAKLAAPDDVPNSIPNEALDLIDSPKIRTKLRLYAILLALYVCGSIPSQSHPYHVQ